MPLRLGILGNLLFFQMAEFKKKVGGEFRFSKVSRKGNFSVKEFFGV